MPPQNKAEKLTLAWKYAASDGGAPYHFLTRQQSGKLPRLKALSATP